MTDPITTSPPFPLARLAAALVGVALVGGAVGVGICFASGNPQWLLPCLAGLGVSVVSFLVSLEIVRRAAAAGPARLAQMAMLTMVVRLATILLGIAVLVHGLGLASKPTALFAVSFYSLLMLIDVTVLVKHLRRTGHTATPTTTDPLRVVTAETMS